MKGRYILAYIARYMGWEFFSLSVALEKLTFLGEVPVCYPTLNYENLRSHTVSHITKTPVNSFLIIIIFGE